MSEQRPDQHLHHNLDGLAQHAERTGRLEDPASIRSRGDRRRRRRTAAVGALGVVLVAVGVGVAFGGLGPDRNARVPAVSPTESPTGPPTSAPSPSPSSEPSTTRPPNGNARPAAVFAGERQIFLRPEGGEVVLGVTDDGRIGLSGGYDDATLFALKKVTGDRYWIQTAKLRAGGEAWCLGAEDAGAGPAAVHTVACDASDRSQLWRFREIGEAEGRPTYTIYTEPETFIVQDPDGTLDPGGTGVAAVVIDEGAPDIDTPFLLDDQGRAQLPALD